MLYDVFCDVHIVCMGCSATPFTVLFYLSVHLNFFKDFIVLLFLFE
jgi:hypothetical protein